MAPMAHIFLNTIFLPKNWTTDGATVLLAASIRIVLNYVSGGLTSLQADSVPFAVGTMR